MSRRKGNAGDDFPPAHEQDMRAILFLDVVDSVRLIEQAPTRAIDKWRTLLHKIRSEVLPTFNGVLKKSLGDGLLAHFATAHDAAAAALAIQELSVAAATDSEAADVQHLRIGIDFASFIEDEHDLYGHGVNVAARLMKLADPGEIVVSVQLKERLVTGVDADIEDLGACYLKNVSAPVRAYRIGPVSQSRLRFTLPINDDMLPRLAVLSFRSQIDPLDRSMLGDVIADEIITALSKSQYLRVISRLSSGAFKMRNMPLSVIADSLAADYVLSGRYIAADDSVRLTLELADTNTNEIVWVAQRNAQLDALLSLEQNVLMELTSGLHQAIFGNEVDRVRRASLPTLQSYSLLLGAVALMHRMSFDDFCEAKTLLEHVIERWQHEAAPRAWLAKWYVLRAQQGWSEDADRDSYLALDSARRALGSDPDSSLALTIDGLVHTHMLKDHETAHERYAHAVRSNPNDSLAWVLKGAGHAFTDEGTDAVQCTQTALHLSPLDPQRYYYDTLAATAHLAAREYSAALEAANRSLQANATHTSSFRAKAIALLHLGREDEARAAGARLMTLEPDLTISAWRARSPSDGYQTGEIWAEALAAVGVPG